MRRGGVCRKRRDRGSSPQPGDSRPEREREGQRRATAGENRRQQRRTPPHPRRDARAPGVWARRGVEGSPEAGAPRFAAPLKPLGPRAPNTRRAAASRVQVSVRAAEHAQCVCTQDALHSLLAAPLSERVYREPPTRLVRWERWKKAQGWSSFCVRRTPMYLSQINFPCTCFSSRGECVFDPICRIFKTLKRVRLFGAELAWPGRNGEPAPRRGSPG